MYDFFQKILSLKSLYYIHVLMNFTAKTYQSTSEEEMYNDPELVFGLS